MTIGQLVGLPFLHDLFGKRKCEEVAKSIRLWNPGMFDFRKGYDKIEHQEIGYYIYVLATSRTLNDVPTAMNRCAMDSGEGYHLGKFNHPPHLVLDYLIRQKSTEASYYPITSEVRLSKSTGSIYLYSDGKCFDYAPESKDQYLFGKVIKRDSKSTWEKIDHSEVFNSNYMVLMDDVTILKKSFFTIMNKIVTGEIADDYANNRKAFYGWINREIRKTYE
ncbi:hypothetical protein [Ekhidna sp.]|uniref:hypothetical protein n=1 Tax=Ekhidna sp. TaxID=2608089 RepID=UPI003C7BBF4B